MKLLLLVTFVAGLALAAKSGTLSGTVMNADHTPMKGFAVDAHRSGYEDYAPKSRFLFRTDKAGHFRIPVPAGEYSLKIASRDGKILKEIPVIIVEAGKSRDIGIVDVETK